MNKEKLIAAGIDYNEGVARFSDHAMLYEKYLGKFLQSPLMEQLEQQLTKGAISEAFHTAHDLKGASGNLSMNAYYEKICELTECLRHGDNNYTPIFTQLKKLYAAIKEAAEEA
ncbi:MAG: Hpt domain-containing protein [Desulfovibrionaceae bacterium]|nr:Hpt domain-containing protein [Desulfovibrionaceae bacterium]